MKPDEHDLPPAGEIRSVSIRVPGMVALLLAIPVLLLAGLLALAGLVAGVAALVLMPWLARRHPRSFDAEESTITLDPTAYRRADGNPERADRLLIGPRKPEANAGDVAPETDVRGAMHRPER